MVVAVAAAEMAGARLVRPFAALRNACSRRRSADGRVSNSAADTAGARQTDPASSSRRERGEGEGGGRESEGGGEGGGGEGEGGGNETSPSISASESGTAISHPVSQVFLVLIAHLYTLVFLSASVALKIPWCLYERLLICY